ncbi:hypothetical protein ABT294_34780 [Nonomuraea sp. NPDC000554]|uniref:hypothetical protein n=1 Tax=Nonomuraea sp. NPDC000554 TaxID=3154259 RepID=UPI00331E8658
MSLVYSTTPVPLPPPLRFLTETENNEMSSAVIQAAQEYSVDWDVAKLIVYPTLSAIGLFTLPRMMLPDDCCHALKLAWDTTQYLNPMIIGLWFNCERDRGHGSTNHHGGPLADWSDGEPGTVPDTRTA